MEPEWIMGDPVGTHGWAQTLLNPVLNLLGSQGKTVLLALVAGCVFHPLMFASFFY